MITIKSKDLSEKQLAEIALAIQNRWQIPVFVKIHEIMIVDDEEIEMTPGVITVPLDSRSMQKGFDAILENLEMDRSFKIQQKGRNNYELSLVDPSSIPNWINEIEKPQPVPEGVFVCAHCVLPQTFILGDNKPIVDYDAGNYVLTRNGLGSVSKTFAREYSGNIIRIKANGMLPIETTPEHEILIVSRNSSMQRGVDAWHKNVSLSDERWVCAKELVPNNRLTDGDYVIVPIIKGTFEEYEVSLPPFLKNNDWSHPFSRESFTLNYDTAWILGLCTGAGPISEEAIFSVDDKEEVLRGRIETVSKSLGYWNIATTEKGHSMLLHLTSRVLQKAFDYWCGHEAPNKKIPDFILLHSDTKILESFLQGYEVGESYVYVNKLSGNKSFRVSSTKSRLLAMQLQLAHLRLHRWASISVKHTMTETLTMGRKVATLPTYHISYPIEPNPKRKKVRFSFDKIFSPIREITKWIYQGSVHNLETTDGTYLVSNAIVHNCGKWCNTEIERTLHQRLHYII